MRRALTVVALVTACEVEGPIEVARLAWSINGQADQPACPTLDTCADVGAENLRVRFVSTPDGKPQKEALWPCEPEYSALYKSLTAGRWEMEVALVDAAGEELTLDQSATLDVGEKGGADTCVNFTPESFFEPRMGVFRFTLLWGGLACAEAHVAEMNIGGDVSECGDGEQALAKQSWGWSTLDVQGNDDDQQVCFDTTFDILIGAGENPAVPLDVMSAQPACP